MSRTFAAGADLSCPLDRLRASDHVTGMDDIEVLFEDPRWSGTALEHWVRMALSATRSHLGLSERPCSIAVLACDDARIAELNGDFRNAPKPTNVLSWPASDIAPGGLPEDDWGDVAIAYDTCAREARAQAKPFDAHVCHLLVHAILHLLGYDHQTEAEATQMEGLEVEILGNLGYPDPY